MGTLWEVVAMPSVHLLPCSCLPRSLWAHCGEWLPCPVCTCCPALVSLGHYGHTVGSGRHAQWALVALLLSPWVTMSTLWGVVAMPSVHLLPCSCLPGSLWAHCGEWSPCPVCTCCPALISLGHYEHTVGSGRHAQCALVALLLSPWVTMSTLWEVVAMPSVHLCPCSCLPRSLWAHCGEWSPCPVCTYCPALVSLGHYEHTVGSGRHAQCALVALLLSP